jgi:small nuclear ribonucleoprotein D2
MSSRPKSELTAEELAEREAEEFKIGPLSILTQSVKNNAQVLISCRNNRKLLGRVKAFDRFVVFKPSLFTNTFRHCNMVLEDVKGRQYLLF